METTDLLIFAVILIGAMALVANAALLWSRAKSGQSDQINKDTSDLVIEAQRLSAIQSTLLELAQFETPSLDLQLQKYLIVSAANLSTNRVGLWQLNQARDELHCISMLQNGEQVTENWTIKVAGKTEYFESLTNGRLALISDTSMVDDENNYSHEYLTPRNIKALLDVPVTINGELIAIVTHEDTQTPRAWTPEEQDQATMIADLCAVAFVSEENREAAAKLQVSEKLLGEARKIAKLDSFIWQVEADELLLSDTFMTQIVGPSKIESLAELAKFIGESERPTFLNDMQRVSTSADKRLKKIYPIAIESQTIKYLELIAEVPEKINSESLDTIVSGTIQDVTERVVAEQTTVKLQARLIEAEKLETIGTLAKGVAHDFNNLLTPVIGYAEILSSEFAADDPKKQYSDQINKSGLRAKNLVEQLLTFSRQEDVSHQLIDLSKLCATSTDSIAKVIRSKVIFTNLASDPLVIAADESQIHQVLLNLSQNADSATQGSGEIHITLQTADLENKGQHALICLTDNGPGINPEVRQHMFEPFYTTHEVGDGPGLGLSVVHGIVKQHRATIEVESEVESELTRSAGKTTFRLYFPMAERHQS